jgi:hypothetical protein
MTTQHRLTGDTTSPGTARRVSLSAITPLLGDAPWVATLTYDTMLVATELVTNAINAGCTQLELAVIVHRSRVRLSVFDDAPGLPRVIAAAPTDLGGRGLALTAALARDWGVDRADNGKHVWAELPIPVDLVLSGALSECHEPPLA